MDEFISTFHIDWKLMIAQIVNFGLVFLIFYLLAAKPLSKLIKDRTEKIETGLSDAQKSRELLQKASEEYKENTIKLRRLSIDAQKELQKDLEQLRAENLERIKKDNDEWQRDRIKQMEIDKKAIIESAKKEIIDLAMLATKKLIGDNANGSFNEKTIKELNNL